MDTNVTSRRRLVHFDRGAKNHPLALRANGTLPPRDLFASHPDALAEYDTLVTLREAVTMHRREARTKRDAAERARAEYRTAVSDALKSGTDPSKLKSKADQYDAEADAHEGFSRTAESKAERQGQIAGDAIKGIAAECFTAAEHDMAVASEKVTAALESLTAALEQQATAWAARRWLSTAHHLGGINAWHGGTIATPVREALANITATADDLTILKTDEAELTRWRQQNEAAAASNAAAFAS